MNKIKEKANNFWEEHKSTVKKVGVGICIGAGVIVTGKLVKSAYVGGVMDGTVLGFHAAMEWLDDNFPEESKAKELYKSFVEAHPDDIVYRIGFGKYSTKQ